MVDGRAAAVRKVSDEPRTVATAAQPLLDELQPVFEELGLNGYQARVLLALLQAGSATAIDLARMTDVPRTSVYPVLHELSAKRLVAQVPGKSSTWVSPGETEVLDRLHAEQQERFENLGSRVARARELLEEISAEPAGGSFPYVHIIHSAAQARLTFHQRISATQTELLMFTRPPASTPGEEPSPTVLELLARGVSCRVLYQAADIVEPPDPGWLPPLDEYHDAGVQGRVVDDLPMKLAIFDREVALLALSDPVVAEVGFPTCLLVEHAGFTSLQVRAFESLWDSGEPFASFVDSIGAKGAGASKGRDRRRPRTPGARSRRAPRVD